MRSAMYRKMVHDTGSLDSVQECLYIINSIKLRYRVGDEFDQELREDIEYLAYYLRLIEPAYLERSLFA